MIKLKQIEGYSKVDENTWINLVPLLTGQSHRNFPLVTLRSYVDYMPLIWKENVMTHFETFFAWDSPDISTFNFINNGFKHVPTDYYFRPSTFWANRPLSVKSYFDIHIEYLKEFLSRYRNKRKFTFYETTRFVMNTSQL